MHDAIRAVSELRLLVNDLIGAHKKVAAATEALTKANAPNVERHRALNDLSLDCAQL
jgi:hypothetical protein